MERQLWRSIVAVLKAVLKPRGAPNETFSCEDVVRVWFWAVLHDRPVSWAVRRTNWPLHERRRALPSASTMSRRLRTPQVQTLIRLIEERVLRSRGEKPLVWIIDGKPLPINNCSKDRQAGFGRAGRGKAKGYKLHAIQGADRSIAAWRIAPMNVDERVMARRLVREAKVQGYLVADSNYDSNPLHEVCSAAGELQLVTRPRGGYGLAKRRKKQSAGRQRSIELLEHPDPRFGRTLLAQRDDIERNFGNLSNWGGGLTHLPAWARTHRRVHRWVQAKLILDALKRRPCNET